MVVNNTLRKLEEKGIQKRQRIRQPKVEIKECWLIYKASLRRKKMNQKARGRNLKEIVNKKA